MTCRMIRVVLRGSGRGWGLVLALGLLALGCGGGASAPGPGNLQVRPERAELTVGDTLRFAALEDGKPAVGTRWSVLQAVGGRIAQDGTYTAPDQPGLFHVRAQGPGGTAQAVIQVHEAPRIISLSADPSPARAGATVQIRAEFSGGRGLLEPDRIPVESGQPAEVRLEATRTFRLRVQNPVGRSDEWALEVPVLPPAEPGKAAAGGAAHGPEAVLGPAARPGAGTAGAGGPGGTAGAAPAGSGRARVDIQAPAVARVGNHYVAWQERRVGGQFEWSGEGVAFLGGAVRPQSAVAVFTPLPGRTDYLLRVRTTGGLDADLPVGEGDSGTGSRARRAAEATFEFRGRVEPAREDEPAIRLERPFLTAGSSGHRAWVGNRRPGTVYRWHIRNGAFPGADPLVATGPEVQFSAGSADFLLLTCTATRVADGQARSATVGVGLLAPPAAPDLATVDPVAAGVIQTAFVTAPQPGLTYRWALDDPEEGRFAGDLRSLEGPAVAGFRIPEPGPFTLRCQAVNAAGAESAWTPLVGNAVGPFALRRPRLAGPVRVPEQSQAHLVSVQEADASLEYAWELAGDGSLDATRGPAITFRAGAPGRPLVLTCTVREPRTGATSHDSLVVEVVPAPVRPALQGPVAPGPDADHVAAVLNHVPGQSYRWRLADTPLEGEDRALAVFRTPARPGAYRLECVAVNALGQDSEAGTFDLVVTAAPPRGGASVSGPLQAGPDHPPSVGEPDDWSASGSEAGSEAGFGSRGESGPGAGPSGQSGPGGPSGPGLVGGPVPAVPALKPRYADAVLRLGREMTAQGPIPPLAWPSTVTYAVAGELPPGLRLDEASGAIRGIPEAIGRFPFQIRASAGPVSETSDPVTYTVAPAEPLALRYPRMRLTAVARTAWPDQVPILENETPGYATSFQLVSGALPDGLRLAPDGTLAGFPKRAGVFDFAIRATRFPDQAEARLHYEFTPGVRPALTYPEELRTDLRRPVYVAPSDRQNLDPLNHGVRYRRDETFGDLPPGLAVEPGSGAIRGVASREGRFPFRVIADDGVEQAVSNVITATVLPITPLDFARPLQADPGVVELGHGGRTVLSWAFQGFPDELRLTRNLFGTPGGATPDLQAAVPVDLDARSLEVSVTRRQTYTLTATERARAAAPPAAPAPVDGVPQAPPPDGVPDAPPLDGVPDAPPLDGVPEAPPLDGVPEAPPMDGAPTPGTAAPGPRTVTSQVLVGLRGVDFLAGQPEAPAPETYSDGVGGVPAESRFEDAPAVAAVPGTAHWRHVRGLALHGGFLYFSEGPDDTLRRFNLATRAVERVTGVVRGPDVVPPAGALVPAARLNNPGPIAVFQDQLFICDTGSHTLKRYTPASNTLEVFAGAVGQAGDAAGNGAHARFDRPADLAVNAAAGLGFVADARGLALVNLASRDVLRLAPDRMHGQDFRFPLAGVAVDPATSIVYLTVVGQHQIFRLTPDNPMDLWHSAWTAATLVGHEQPGKENGNWAAARFRDPAGLAMLGDRLLVADSGNRMIRAIRFDHGGQVATVVGNPDQPGFQDGTGNGARFQSPDRVVAGAGPDQFFVVDQNGTAIRECSWTAGGGGTFRVRTVGGIPAYAALVVANGARPRIQNGTGTAAILRRPLSMVVERTSGTAYFLEEGTQTVRKLDVRGEGARPSGTVDLVAGEPNRMREQPRAPGHGPAGAAAPDPAAAAAEAEANRQRLRNPTEIQMDGNGRLYVLEPEENQVLRLAVQERKWRIQPFRANLSDLPPGAGARRIHLAVRPSGPGDLFLALSTYSTAAVPTPWVIRLYREDGAPGTVVARLAQEPQALAAGFDSRIYALIADPAQQVCRVKIFQRSALALDPDAWQEEAEAVFGPGGPGGQPIGFPEIHAMAVDTRGDLFLSDLANGVIWKMAPDRHIFPIIGRAGVQLPPAAAVHDMLEPVVAPRALAVTEYDDLLFASNRAIFQATAPGLPDVSPWRPPEAAPAFQAQAIVAPRVVVQGGGGGDAQVALNYRLGMRKFAQDSWPEAAIGLAKFLDKSESGDRRRPQAAGNLRVAADHSLADDEFDAAQKAGLALAKYYQGRLQEPGPDGALQDVPPAEVRNRRAAALETLFAAGQGALAAGQFETAAQALKAYRRDAGPAAPRQAEVTRLIGTLPAELR